ncbi:MAG: protein kinase [Betaproteobacteria bacterium]|nr:protein kinase [Betaproteobacteria bacterium]
MKILVVEDEASIRANLSRLLTLEDYEVASAENGRVALETVKSFQPDLILCDVMMPELDGFGVLKALREDESTEPIPLVFLTALDDKDNLRKAMGHGADDYITKPFTRDDVLTAVNARLARLTAARKREAQRVDREVSAHETRLMAKFQNSLAGRPQDGLDVMPANAEVTESREATVLFADIRRFTTISEQLSSVEVAELLNAYFSAVCEPIVAAGGEAIKFIGDGLMAVFSPEHLSMNRAVEGPHAHRALQAALGMTLAAHRFRGWINARYADRNLPEFAIGVGVHTGEVMMCHVGSGGQREFTAIGDTVNLASRLEGKTKELGWSIIASLDSLHAAGEGIEFGHIETVWVRGRAEPVEAVEITGIDTEAASTSHGLIELATDIRNALKVNSDITGRAVKAALEKTQRMAVLQPSAPNPTPMPNAPRVKGYVLRQKIGEGGMSEVYMAERDSDRLCVALKLFEPASGDNDLLSRFIQEYALIVQIDHPNVVKIYDQAFSDELAYIVMEYFPGGDLRRPIAEGMTPDRVIDILAQAARALGAVHAQGIIHRDLKPDNLMLRADGSIGLVDFGVAKRARESLGLTRHGQVVGTPFYLSPEQAQYAKVTPQSDLYSLGVMAYEMFTGEKPYQADSIEDLMRQHVGAPVPKLPATLAAHQPLIDRLMAKQPQGRFADACALEEYLTRG